MPGVDSVITTEAWRQEKEDGVGMKVEGGDEAEIRGEIVGGRMAVFDVCEGSSQ